MSSGAIRAGRAFVELFADDSKLARGLKNAQRKVQAFAGGVRNIGMGMIGVGAAVIAPLLAATVQFAATGDMLNKMAARTGVAVEELSALGFAAQRSGSDLKTLEGGLKRMQANLSDFKRGDGDAADRLKDLGFDKHSLDGVSQAGQFKALADAIAAIADPGERAAAAMDIFGKSGQQLVPLLSQGREGIEALQRKAEELGIVVSTKAAQQAADFSDAWLDVKTSLDAVTQQLAIAVMPAITSALQAITPIITTAVEWISQNKELVVTIAAVAVGVAGLGTGLVALSGVVAAAGAVIGGVTTVVGALSAAFTFLLSPIGLVVVAVGAAAAAMAGLVAWGIHASGVLDGIGEVFGEVFGGIIGALGSGDLEAAGEIAMLGLYAIWSEIWNNMQQLAFDKMKSIIQTMKDWGLDKVLELTGVDADKALAGFDLLSNGADAEVAAIRQELSDLIAEQKAKSGTPADPLDTPAAQDFTEIMRDLEDAIVEAGGGSNVPAGDAFISPGELAQVGAAAGARDGFLKSADVSGTFSGSALNGLGPETLQRSQLRAMDEMNEHLAEIERGVKYNKLNYLK